MQEAGKHPTSNIQHRTSNRLRLGDSGVSEVLWLPLVLLAGAMGIAPLSAGAEAVLLSGATVHTISGETLAPGQVLIRDGKIAAVGKTVTAEGATSIDLAGQHLYPGLIALNTVLGLTETPTRS